MASEEEVGQTETATLEVVEVEELDVEIDGGTSTEQPTKSEEHISASLIKADEKKDDGDDDDGPKKEEMTIELPRDILTAYILCRLIIIKEPTKG